MLTKMQTKMQSSYEQKINKDKKKHIKKDLCHCRNVEVNKIMLQRSINIMNLQDKVMYARNISTVNQQKGRANEDMFIPVFIDVEGNFKTAWARFGPKPAQPARPTQPGKRDSSARGLIQRRLGQLAGEGEGRPELRRRHPTMMSHNHPTCHDLEAQKRVLTST